MSKDQGTLKRLLIKARPQFLEEWLGSAGRLFMNGLVRVSAYSRNHVRLGDRLEDTPDLLWKAAEGAASAQHAKAEADYAKAENDRMEAELRRRTLEAQARQMCANADKAEAEAGIAKTKEIAARLELFKRLRDAGVSVNLDNSLNLLVAKSEPVPPLESTHVLDAEEIQFIQSNLVKVTCPRFDGLPTDRLTLRTWEVTVGSRVILEQTLGEVEASTSPVSIYRIVSPTSGVVVARFVEESASVTPGQLVATIIKST